MKCLGLHNKPTAEVHPGHMLTGPKEEEEPLTWHPVLEELSPHPHCHANLETHHYLTFQQSRFQQPIKLFF
jgi:hypothetical protein